ncbi:MAG: ligase-associated DNA damage response endonuclease PdeM [Bacteroidetes bacterium]|jgi:DNA ligase-associated metallophosphoesterase|nr:ligase-associated DNA damage response endonuclease PdeM [Bacteroidota bacterium]
MATPDAGILPVEIAGVTVWLLPERALYIPSQGALCVADVHIGKAAALQAHAVAVPEGASDADLKRLTTLARRLEATRLIVAGDFVHAPESLSDDIRQALKGWSADLSDVQVDIVRGNHDRGSRLAGVVSQARVHPREFRIGPFSVQHYPEERTDAYIIAGHLHPGLPLTLHGRDRMRLPCFWIQKRQLVLPAFGTFTGLSDVPQTEGRHALVTPDQVLWAPTSA